MPFGGKHIAGIAIIGVAGALLLLSRKEKDTHAKGTTGTLELDTVPTGASVFMKEGTGDYVYKGVTPITLTLKADTMYAFRLTKTGYADAYLPSGYAVEAEKTTRLTWPLQVSIGQAFTYGQVIVLPYSLARPYPPPYGEVGYGITVSCPVSNNTGAMAQLNVTLTADVYDGRLAKISTYQETIVLNISPGATVSFPFYNPIVVGGITDGKVFFKDEQGVKVVFSDSAGGRSEPGYWPPLD